MISAVPQIQTFKLNPSWEFLVLATDGVWDAMSNQDMISFIKSRMHKEPASSRLEATPVKRNMSKIVLSDLCEEILDQCCTKTVEKFGKNCCDNMTIIIICFDQTERSKAEAAKTASSASAASVTRLSRQQQSGSCDKSSDGSSSAVSSVPSR